ncbi:MAG: WD40 repeat domain-containing protein [Candidatus Lokiarchaeota archaeon]|nr:WD40 repeat domain-containing protein [Candidatus Lokiarchaeota archaeon]
MLHPNLNQDAWETGYFFKWDGGRIKRLEFSPDGNMLATVDSRYKDIGVALWDADTGMEKHRISYPGALTLLAFSPDGTTLATATSKKCVCFWDIPTLEMTRVLTLEPWKVFDHPVLTRQEWVTTIAFSPDGSLLATGSNDPLACTWDVITGKKVHVFDCGTQWVHSVAFSPDGTKLAIASNFSGNTIRVWNLHTHEVLHETQARTSSIAFSPDGLLLAWGDGHRRLCLWDMNTNIVRTLVQGHYYFNQVVFSRDGHLLAAGSNDRRIHVWDFREDKESAILRGGHDQITSIAISPDGTSIVGDDGYMHRRKAKE